MSTPIQLSANAFNLFMSLHPLNREKQEKKMISAVYPQDLITWSQNFFTNTVGYVIKESEEVEHNKWKIRGYEDRIYKIKEILINYLSSFMDDLVITDHFHVDEEWIQYIEPLIKFCFIELNQEKQRFHLYYLYKLRQIFYVEFLDSLRHAASWAQNHQEHRGAHHIDAICYRLYTAIDLNYRCYKVLETFKKLGRKEGKNEELTGQFVLPDQKKYDIIRHLYTINFAIDTAPVQAKSPLIKKWMNSALGHLNGICGQTFDPNRQSNFMHVLFEKHLKFATGEEYCVKGIALPSPTIENGSGVAEINPEFLGYLRCCKREGKVHLYNNYQNLSPRGRLYGDESARCRALYALLEEFKETLYLLTLSQNSWFYEHSNEKFHSLAVETIKQKIMYDLRPDNALPESQLLPVECRSQSSMQQWIKEELNHLHQNQPEHESSYFSSETHALQFVKHFYDSLQTYLASIGQKMGYGVYNSSTSAFKEALIAQLFDLPSEETGQKLPDDLIKNHQLREWSEKMITAIHQIVFEGSEQLTLKERRVFIRLVYRNLSQKSLILTKAHSYNKSCKERLDRGPTIESEDFAYSAIVHHTESDEEIIKFFNMLIFARAIMVRKRTVIIKRLERLFETVKFLLDHKEKIQALEKHLFPDLTVSFSHAPLTKKI